MIERSQFTFEGKKFEARAMDIPAGIVAKAFREDGKPASAPYIIPREIISDILAAKLSPSPAAMTLRLMGIVQGDIESDMGKELAQASAALNKA